MRSSFERAALGRQVLWALVIAALVAAIIVAAAVAFGWTLAPAASFDVSPNAGFGPPF